MKRKFIDRSDWKRVLQRRYCEGYFEGKNFKGYVSLLHIEKVKAPLVKCMFSKEYCIVDEGYIWLQHLPVDKNYAFTTMYDSNGNIVQWYFDIIKASGSVGGRPYFDDLYLDVVLIPDGKVLLLDEDELAESLNSGDIEKEDYDMAYKEVKAIMDYAASHVEEIKDFSNEYLGKMKLLL